MEPDPRAADPKRLVVWILIAIVAVGGLMSVAMAFGGGWQWMGGWGWMMPFGMMLMWLPLIFVILLVLHVVGPRAAESSTPDPERVLAARYARGELTREEYLRMREDLRTGR